MKNKIYKKIGLLSISAIVALSFSVKVNAEQKCEEVTKTNYYFFSGIYSESKLNELITEGGNHYNGTFFPSLPKNIKDTSATISKKICLSQDETDQYCDKNDFDLEKFYTTYKKIMAASKEKSFKATYKDKNGNSKEETTKVFYLTEGNTTYYVHDKWYLTDENYNVTSDTSEKIVRYQSIDNSELVKGAIIPSSTVINLQDAGSEATMFNIGRNITSNNIVGKTGFDLPSYSETEKTYLSPALYRVTYTIEECTELEPEKKFTADIKYVDKDTKKEVHDPYNEKDLANGYKKTVDSPKVEGCKLVDANDAQVSYKIDNKNFEKIVYYNCEVSEPGKTGNVLIFIAWVVGLGSLGYSVYWFKKNKKEEV